MENSLKTKHQNEIQHGKKLLKLDAEKTWGHSKKAGQLRVQRRVDLIVNTTKMQPSKKVLEIGCGTGMFTKKFLQSGAEITAIDISKDLLEIAKKNILNSNIHFELAAAEDLSMIKNNYFDAVIGNSVLHHLDYEKALKAFYKVLKPGGKIAFSEPNMLNPQIFLQKNIPAIKKMLGDSPDETAFIKWRLKKILRANNYKNINITNFDFLHPFTPNFLCGFLNQAGKNFFEKIPLIKEITGSLFITSEK